ncbi:hepatitis A virus cellular receptor 1 [Aulostomus maculatus]
MKTVRPFTSLLVCLLTVGESSTSYVTVVGQAGQRVDLPCKYNIKVNKRLFSCWGRGEIPASGCGKQLIATDGLKVRENTRVSSRYQLLGPLEDGDVSLTILNTTEGDSGLYGCRVEIPGLFNDQRVSISLVIQEVSAPQTTTCATFNASREQTPTDNTAGQMTSTETLLTSSSNSAEAAEGSSMTVLVVFIITGLVVLAIAGSFTFITRKMKRVKKIPQQQQDGGLVQFPSLQLQSRGSAEENIYQVDRSEYEYCP